MVLPLAEMPHQGEAQTYVVLARPTNSMAMGKLPAMLKFKVKEIDPSTGEAEEDGYDDEYQLEDVDVGATDYIKAVTVPNFRKVCGRVVFRLRVGCVWADCCCVGVAHATCSVVYHQRRVAQRCSPQHSYHSYAWASLHCNTPTTFIGMGGHG